ncbi:sensor histidine kinase [Paenibacillus herberti]|nr:sensor histidine kinase [Paenibacillus herberti]
MHSILENKTESGIKGNLHQVRLSLDTLLRQLNQVSQQLAFDGQVGSDLEQYLDAQALEKKLLYDGIRTKLNLIQFTNPSVGLMFYFFEDSDEFLFQNIPLKQGFDIGKLPVFDQYQDFTYFGPHESQAMVLNRNVMSIVRKIDVPYSDNLYVYIESDLRLEDNLLKEDSSGFNMVHLIVDHNGVITFSENPKDFPVGSSYETTADSERIINGNYVFEETGNQKWKVVAAIPKKDYESEIRSWMIKFFYSGLLMLIIGIVIAWFLWRSLYRPMRQLSQSIRNVKNDKWDEPFQSINMMEFDSIRQDFIQMRERIGVLMDELEVEGKRKGQLEIEKLMYQINPHFLHNTLDTLRWTARIAGQNEMDKLISALIKVLRYNLGKSGPATIRSELENVKNYMLIQEHRYQFQSIKYITRGITPLDEKGKQVWPAVGDEASLVLVQASCTAEAVARRAERRAVIHKGTLVSGEI